MALRGYGVYSLVAMFLVEELASILLFWVAPVPGPRLVICRAHVGRL